MARIDKGDPMTSTFRVDVAADFPDANIGKLYGWGLDTAGKAVIGAGNSGIVGVWVINDKPGRVGPLREVPRIDLMRQGCVTDFGPTAGTPGVTFVNLQYGDCGAELEEARRDFGVEIWNPPGIDLKQDLDDVAALAANLDLVVGFANASLNIGAAVGAPTWLISAPIAWTRMGTNHYPWYPQTKVFFPQQFGKWEPVMAEVADSMAAFGAAVA